MRSRNSLGSLLFGVLLFCSGTAVRAEKDESSCKRVADLPHNTVVEQCLSKTATTPAFKLAFSGCNGALQVNRLSNNGDLLASIVCQGVQIGYVRASGKLMSVDTVKPDDEEKDDDIPSYARMKACFTGQFLEVVRPTTRR